MNNYYNRKSRYDSAKIVTLCFWGLIGLAVSYFGAHLIVAFFKSDFYARAVVAFDSVFCLWSVPFVFGAFCGLLTGLIIGWLILHNVNRRF